MSARPSIPHEPGTGFHLVAAFNTPIVPPARSLAVMEAGNVEVVGLDGVAVVWPNCPVGFIIPGHVRQVNSAGSTVAVGNLVAIL